MAEIETKGIPFLTINENHERFSFLKKNNAEIRIFWREMPFKNIDGEKIEEVFALICG